MHKIESAKLLKQVMTDYFIGLGNKEKKIAWCTSVGPAELLRSFGFEVYFPENHGALLGTARLSGEFIPVAAKLGYSSEICSYLTSDIGSYLSKNTPMTKHYGLESVPKPDLLVYNTNQCREVQDWMMFYANEFKCPILGIQSPRYLDEVKTSDIDNVTAQFKAMIPTCEEVTGLKFDLDKFKATLKISKEATLLWKQCLETARNVPAPISFFDSTIHMGPIVVLRGTEVAKSYYEALLSELNTHVQAGSGILENEKVRVYWEGMPIWGKLRYSSDLFSSHNAAVVASTYCNSWIFDDFDEDHPFESSALAYSTIFINMSEATKTKRMIKLIEEYQIKGVVFHEAKTCFNNSNSSFGMPQRLKEATGVETLVIEGDLCDLRFFSEAQTTTKIETFIEQIL